MSDTMPNLAYAPPKNDGYYGSKLNFPIFTLIGIHESVFEQLTA
jgi:hypothetical protein